jgi:hypothetical protein
MFPAAHHSCLCGTGIRPVNKRSDIDMMVLNGGMKEQNIFAVMTIYQRPPPEKKNEE